MTDPVLGAGNYEIKEKLPASRSLHSILFYFLVVGRGVGKSSDFSRERSRCDHGILGLKNNHLRSAHTCKSGSKSPSWAIFTLCLQAFSSSHQPLPGAVTMALSTVPCHSCSLLSLGWLPWALPSPGPHSGHLPRAPTSGLLLCQTLPAPDGNTPPLGPGHLHPGRGSRLRRTLCGQAQWLHGMDSAFTLSALLRSLPTPPCSCLRLLPKTRSSRRPPGGPLVLPPPDLPTWANFSSRLDFLYPNRPKQAQVSHLHCLLPVQKHHIVHDSAQPPQEEPSADRITSQSSPPSAALREHTAPCIPLAVAGSSAPRFMEVRTCFWFFLRPSTCPR